MSNLNEYLHQKRSAVFDYEERISQDGIQPSPLSAIVTAEGRSGVRRIRIRQHQILSDSSFEFAGYDLGPNSPELQMGVIGSCITHVFLIYAARRQIPLESLEVEVHAQLDPRGGKPNYESIPVYPFDISYTVHVVSSAESKAIECLFSEVEQNCPILNLIRNSQVINGSVQHTPRENHVTNKRN
jgi:uncharacterized OsmC-like protein